MTCLERGKRFVSKFPYRLSVIPFTKFDEIRIKRRPTFIKRFQQFFSCRCIISFQ